MTSDERLAAAHQLLQDALNRLVSSNDWCRFLDFAARFHNYSPLNVLLLMTQGATGRVAGYHTWRTVPAQEGGTCRVAKGAHGYRILAPLVRSAEMDRPDEEDAPLAHQLVGFKTVVVFDETQLVSPPARPEPPTPALLRGNGPVGLGRALVGAIAARRWRVDFDDSIAPANGRTDFHTHTVTLRHDLSQAQAAKTIAHELAHIELHGPGGAGWSLDRAVKEVEAESVAWLIGHHWGLDSASYSLPYLAHWSAGNEQVLAVTAQRAVTTARRVVQELDEHVSNTPRPAASPGQWPDLTPFSRADRCVHPDGRPPTGADGPRRNR
jgi:hypothetical protein